MNTCDKIDESEKMAENNEIQELIKKAVTSKSLEVLTEAEAQKLVDSQTCRPGMISFFELHFRWMNIKGFDAAFPISVMLFLNHLN